MRLKQVTVHRQLVMHAVIDLSALHDLSKSHTVCRSLDGAVLGYLAFAGSSDGAGLDNIPLWCIQAKLEEYDQVLDDSAERAQEPRQCFEQVLSVLGISHETCTVCEVARQREEKEK